MFTERTSVGLDVQARSVAAAAIDGLLDVAAQAFAPGEASTDPLIAATNLFNKGVVPGQLDRGPEAVDAYRDLATRYGEDTTAEVREQVAKGLVTLGGGDE